MSRCCPGRPIRTLLAGVLLLAAPRTADAVSCTVPTSPGCATIQAAIDQAAPGDTITVREKDPDNTPYFEKVTITTSGIRLVADAGHEPILDGTGAAGAHMILIDGSSTPVDDVVIEGFEIRNNLGVSDGSGIRILGAGDGIAILGNEIHHVTGSDAMGITVYATEATPVSNLIIDGNTIRDCEPARSEALVLNGNVDGFRVSNNVVRDVNNIGIDCIGGETDIQPNPNLVCRNGVIRGNTVLRANSRYEGGYGAGIYVDGGRDVVIENNVVSGCDLGIEIGAENAGRLTENIVVRNNVLHGNEKAGLVFGGYAANVGRASNNSFTGNTLYKNNTLGPSGQGRFFRGNGVGEIWVQFGSNNRLANNLIYAGSEDVFIASYEAAESPPNTFDYNLYFSDTGGLADGEFDDHGAYYQGFAAWQAGSGQDANSVAADPVLADPGAGDFHIAATGPAADAGDPGFAADPNEVDLDGQPRHLGARVDIGADEGTCGNGDPNDPGEQCDDGNAVNCDGCDNNCSLSTTCGNGVLCAPEQCDDGNTAAGDCCSATCGFEAVGASCDDASACTTVDVCDGIGACSGDRIGGPACALDRETRSCQEAIAKVGRKYFETRLQALQDCRNKLNQGRSLSFANGTSLTDPADCAAEGRGAAKIAAAAGKARDGIAKAGRPKCTNTIVARLGACAATVDALVAPGGAGGCLLTAADGAVNAILDDEYGLPLTGTEPTYDALEDCQSTIAVSGRSYARTRLKNLQSCRKSLDRGKALAFANDAPLVDPADCPAEQRVAGKIAAAAAKARGKIAGRCGDAELGPLADACATTLDALIAPGGAGGCLISGHDVDVDDVIDAQY
jgi:cysteine-rich repeat protein/parallel beta-helix repeat protein